MCRRQPAQYNAEWTAPTCEVLPVRASVAMIPALIEPFSRSLEQTQALALSTPEAERIAAATRMTFYLGSPLPKLLPKPDTKT